MITDYAREKELKKELATIKAHQHFLELSPEQRKFLADKETKVRFELDKVHITNYMHGWANDNGFGGE